MRQLFARTRITLDQPAPAWPEYAMYVMALSQLALVAWLY